MESIILQSPSLHNNIDVVQPSESNHGSPKRSRLASFSATRESISWGRRHHHGSWIHALGCASIMFLCPCLVIFMWISLSSFNGSLMAAFYFMREYGPTKFYSTYAPKPDLTVSAGYALWILFQATLYQFLPSRLSTGQLTPAGNLLKYRTNGLLAWFVTHTLFVAAALSGLLDAAILARHWEGLLITANFFGFLLSGFVYVKAHLSPTHDGDRKFSGSMFYDVFMGIELNPRFGKYFDFKLFTNGRPGIIAWTLM